MITQKQSLSILKKRFQKDLSELLEKYGFKSTHERYIERRENGSNQVIHLAFVDNRQEQYTSLILDLSIRLNQIEEIATACSWANDLTSKEKKEMSTLGIQIGELVNRGQIRWNIHNLEECKVVAKEVLELLEEVGIPYLVEHSNINNILKRFESENFKNWHCHYESRAIRLPIIYLLLNKVDCLNSEVSQLYKHLLKTDAYLAPAYPKFVSELCERFNIKNPMEVLNE